LHGSVLGFFAYGALQSWEIRDKDILEVGSLNVNGTVRPLVEARKPASYIGIDIVDGVGVDRVIDAADLIATFGLNSFDVVISTEMLEHAQDWRAALTNMVGVLRPEGTIVLTTRSQGATYHNPPDYWRYTPQFFIDAFTGMGLEPIAVLSDPDLPGVFAKAIKPKDWRPVYTPLGDIDGVTPIYEPLKVFVLPTHPDGVGYYRMWQPHKELERSSAHTVLVPDPGAQGLPVAEETVDEFDIFVGQRGQVRPWKHWQHRIKLIFDIDDNLLLPDTAALPQWTRTEVQDSLKESLEVSHLITTSTPILASELRKYNDNVAVIPNYVHARILDISRKHRDKITIVFAGGDNHLQDIMMIQNPMTQILQTEDVILHNMGVDYEPVFDAPHKCRFTYWNRNIWDYYNTIDGDVAIIPLKDTPMNNSRSYIKALEYAALGIPVVASDVPPYRGFVLDGVTGFLVKTRAEWIDRVRELIHNESLRHEMGTKARELARDYTIQRNWQKREAIYEKLGEYRQG
jgi:hypothetical protein